MHFPFSGERESRTVGSDQVHTIAFYGLLSAGNLGNDASFETVREWLTATDARVRIVGITTHPERFENQYGLTAWPIAIRAPGSRSKVLSISGRLVCRLGDMPRAFRLAGKVDTIVIPGMGVLEDSIPVSPGGFPLLMLSVALACRARGRRFVLLDVGADISPHPITRWLFLRAAMAAAHVSYRDTNSAAAIDKARRATVVPDLVFAHPARNMVSKVSAEIVIGVMRFGRQTEITQYERKMLLLVEALLERGHNITLIGGDLSDYETAEVIAVRIAENREWAQRVRIARAQTYIQLLEALSKARVVVASRYHNLVASISLEKPVISLNYAQKCGDLLAEAGLSQYAHQMHDFSVSQVLDHVDHLWENHTSISTEIRDRTQNYCSTVESLLHEVFWEENRHLGDEST